MTFSFACRNRKKTLICSQFIVVNVVVNVLKVMYNSMNKYLREYMIKQPVKKNKTFDVKGLLFLGS